MRTGSLICLLVRKCLCVSISRGKPSIYFLLNIGYPLRPSRRAPSSSSVRPSRCPSRRRRPSSVRPSVPSSVPSSSAVLCPSVHVHPSSSSVLCPSVRPVVVVVRPLSVRPVVRLNITCKTSRSIRRIAYVGRPYDEHI